MLPASALTATACGCSQARKYFSIFLVILRFTHLGIPFCFFLALCKKACTQLHPAAGARDQHCCWGHPRIPGPTGVRAGAFLLQQGGVSGVGAQVASLGISGQKGGQTGPPAAPDVVPAAQRRGLGTQRVSRGKSRFGVYQGIFFYFFFQPLGRHHLASCGSIAGCRSSSRPGASLLKARRRPGHAAVQPRGCCGPAPGCCGPAPGMLRSVPWDAAVWPGGFRASNPLLLSLLQGLVLPVSHILRERMGILIHHSN